MKKQLIFLFCLCVAVAAMADDNPAVEAIQEYMEFAEYSDGAISTAQLTSVGAVEILFIDTMSPDQYESGDIPDARKIEWREQHPDLITGDNSDGALLEEIKVELAKLKLVNRTRKRAKA